MTCYNQRSPWSVEVLYITIWYKNGSWTENKEQYLHIAKKTPIDSIHSHETAYHIHLCIGKIWKPKNLDFQVNYSLFLATLRFIELFFNLKLWQFHVFKLRWMISDYDVSCLCCQFVGVAKIIEQLNRRIWRIFQRLLKRIYVVMAH